MGFASKEACWALALLSALCFCATPSCAGAKGAAAAAAAAPPAAADCSSALLSLADCLGFVEEGSKQGKPQGQCCAGLKKVVKEEVSCLCQAFKGGAAANYGIKLNMTKALALPSACGVKTPPFSKCNMAIGGAPVAAPVFSPAATPLGSPSIGESVARVPAPSPMHSAAGSLLAPSLASLLVTAAALFCNNF